MTPFVRLKLTFAWQCIRDGDLAGAKEQLEEALSSGETHASLEALRAVIAHREGRREEAEAIARGVLERFGPEAVALGVLGRIQLEAGNPEKALGALEEGYRLRPHPYPAQGVLEALRALKRFEAAERFLQEALGRFPGDLRLLKEQVHLHVAQGEREQAREAVAEILTRDPQNSWARRMQIELRSNRGAAGEIATLLSVGERGSDPNLRGLYAKKLREAGDVAAAACQYAEAAKLAPENPYWREQAGFAFAKAGNDQEAIRYLRPLFLKNPKNVYVRSALFAALKRRGGSGEVLAAIEDAIAQNPQMRFLLGLRRKYAPKDQEAHGEEPDGR